MFLYYNISFIFSGKDNSGSYYERKILYQNQNQNCLLVIRPRTIIHQDLCLGKLVPSPHKRSKLSN